MLYGPVLDATAPAVVGNMSAVDWITAGVVLVGAVVAGRVFQLLLLRTIRRGDSEKSAADTVARVIATLVVAVGLLWSLSILGVRLGPLVGAFGVGGIAIAFAAQAILANFLGSIILQLRRPFRRGDQIATGSCEGTVEEVNFRTVVLRTFDGERVLVPCTSVLNNPIINHTTLGRRRTTVSVGVAFESDLEQARKELLAAASSVEGVLERPRSEVWVTAFRESDIELEIRVWHAPDMATLWRVRSEVLVAAKRALDDAGIDLPVPQRAIRLARSYGPEGPEGPVGPEGEDGDAGAPKLSDGP